MVCTFFGHRDTPQEIQFKLQNLLIDLIENRCANTFYIGNQGNFDLMVSKVLKSLQLKYPHIEYVVVLPYISCKKDEFDYEDYSDTMYPEGLEDTPPRFAISKRNRWLVEHSDTVITYVKHSWGGAAQYKELAERRGKEVINLI